MRYLLALTSIIYTFVLNAAEGNLADSLIESFYKSKDYQIYLDADFVSAQVMVPVKIESFDEVVQLPNPVLANIFIKYLKREYELDSEVVHQPLNTNMSDFL